MVKTEERFYIHYYFFLYIIGGSFLLKKEDLTGNRYGKLTVKKMLYNHEGKGRTKCLCVCDCGNECIRIAYNLKKATDSSCGCGKKEYIRKSCGKDIDGKKFGRLTVLETLWEEYPPRVRCICDCGNIVILRKSDVQQLHTQSCGCLQRERVTENNETDYTNVVSDYGVKMVSRYRQNKTGQWLWNCKCGLCGSTFQDIPARVLNNHVRSCGCLKSSSNEIFISNYLNELNVDYIPQYTFPDCKSNKNYNLYFDFAIFKDNRLFCLIEYDGAQHFRPVDLFGGENAFIETKERDEIKNEYCKNNGIPLYRLSYQVSNEEVKEKIMNIIYP